MKKMKSDAARRKVIHRARQAHDQPRMWFARDALEGSAMTGKRLVHVLVVFDDDSVSSAWICLRPGVGSDDPVSIVVDDDRCIKRKAIQLHRSTQGRFRTWAEAHFAAAKATEPAPIGSKAVPQLIEALQECVTDEGAHCMQAADKSPVALRNRIRAINAAALAALRLAKGGA
ncbi:hypothetical protein [Thiocapsa sp. N5-Cardenillas]|uniref:hypothetical protein n=1 Tax=Thiocapsa sp. N5-Cardenillas TaxID=3137397 RepID=UPI0035B3E4B9